MSREEAAKLLEGIRKLFLNSVYRLYETWSIAPRLEDSSLAQSKRAKGMPDSWPALCEISAYLLFRIDSQLSQLGVSEKLRKWALVCAGDTSLCPDSPEDTDRLLASRAKHYAGLKDIFVRRAEVNPNAGGAMMCASLIHMSLQKYQNAEGRLANEKAAITTPIDKNEILAGAKLGKATDEATESIIDLFKQLFVYFPTVGDK
jgi:hypothetical protein